jgi:RND family efflux transporter MFP subunit
MAASANPFLPMRIVKNMNYWVTRFRPRHVRRAIALPFAALVASSACGRPAARAGGPPAMPVEVVTLAERPVEQTTEFAGVVKSRQSTNVQPQVEGFITRIRVKSGDRVAPGAPLIEIDPRMQDAVVASLESQLVSRKADLQQRRQEAERMKTLLAAGAASQAEAEQAETGLATAQAQVLATEAQLREQRVALAYHTVTAPTAGVVGDIPVRVGDRVTKTTLLTTIDQNAGLELYINVPVQEAARLKPGLPVHLVDDRGEVFATERLSFVSASVDGAMQSVLAKATLEKAEGLRTEQFVRARIVWSQLPSLTVPVVALNRIGGQYFAYVAEGGEAGTVARQRLIVPGPVVGNDYVVMSGLKAGERLIVSGIQKIGEGAPVTILAKAAAPTADPKPAPAGKGE